MQRVPTVWRALPNCGETSKMSPATDELRNRRHTCTARYHFFTQEYDHGSSRKQSKEEV